MAAAIAGSLHLAGSAAFAQNEPIWPVKGKLEGKPKDDGRETRKSVDVSGIACSTPSGFPRTCLVIDDELQSAQIVVVEDGRLVAGSSIKLTNDSFDNQALELDGEGVAYANGFYYVAGSHGRPRGRKRDPSRSGADENGPDARALREKDDQETAANIAARSQVVRIAFDPARVDAEGHLSGQALVRRSRDLHTILDRDPVLHPFVDQPLEQNGISIEGIAVRDGRMYFGMRTPGDGVILSIAEGALFEGAPPDAKTHRLHLGPGQGVRDLAPVANGLLVLSGPTNDADGPYSVSLWDGGDGMRVLKPLATYRTGQNGRIVKPEAILPLDEASGGQRVLILFDGATEGDARPIQIGK